MGVPILGLTLLLLYGLLAVGLRVLIQVRRTGSTGFTGLRGDVTAVDRTVGGLLALAVVLSVAGTTLQMTGTLVSIKALSGNVVTAVGATLASFGIGVTVVAQFAMGDAWRVGVDSSERTQLVSHGLFSVVRNPIYAAMIPAFTGVALIAPNVLAIAGAVLLVVALELQTRFVEEPYLLETHGQAYVIYATRVGRFVPAIGRLAVDRRTP